MPEKRKQENSDQNDSDEEQHIQKAKRLNAKARSWAENARKAQEELDEEESQRKLDSKQEIPSENCNNLQSSQLVCNDNLNPNINKLEKKSLTQSRQNEFFFSGTDNKEPKEKADSLINSINLSVDTLPPSSPENSDTGSNSDTESESDRIVYLMIGTPPSSPSLGMG